MLSPTSPTTPLLLGAVLVAVIGLLVVRALRKDRREYRRFKRYRSTVRRQRMYRKWLLDSFLTFGGSSVVVLALVWQHIPLFLDDVNGYGWVASARAAFARSDGLAAGVIAGIVIALAGGMVFVIFAARNVDTVPAIGDIQALLPRNRAELRYGAALSINAGIVEEALFRLAVPVLVFGATGSSLLAIAGSLALFGALHLYQGVAGVVGSAIIGVLLMALYLGTGSILAAMAMHALIDLRSLVLIPIVVYKAHRRPVRPTSPAPPGSPDLSLPPL